MRIPRQLVLIALAFVGAVAPVAVASPAGAANATMALTAQTGDPADDALLPFQAEVMLIAELGGFPEPLPDRVASEHARWRSFTEGLDRAGLLDWLRQSDADGLAALGPLQATRPVSGDVVVGLSLLPADSMAALDNSMQVEVPVEVYDRALADLQDRGGAAPGGSSNGSGSANGSGAAPAGVAPVTAPRVASKAPVAPTAATKGAPAPGPTAASAPSTMAVPADAGTATDATPTTEAAAADEEPAAGRSDASSDAPSSSDDEATGAPAWIPVAASLGSGTPVVIGLVFVVRRRRERRRHTSTADAAMASLLEAGRQMGSSLSTIEILRILVDESRHLTDSDVGLVMLAEDSGARLAASTDPNHAAPDTHRGVVRRVLDTGIATRTVASGEVAATRQSIAAAPLVRRGAVNGVLIVARGPEREYTSTELDLLTHLAPLGAAALVAAEAHDDGASQTVTDGLTGLANRRRLDRDLPAALASGGAGVGFVMVDVDHFKHYNDTHGHPAGDAVLRTVADVLRASVRECDVVYRYGGEEFCVLLPDTNEREASEIAERLRHAVEAAPIPGAEQQPNGRVTVSVGLAMAAAADPSDLTDRADRALYEAKHGGRNRVVVSPDDAT